MSGLESIQILIADDNRQMRLLVKQLLRAFGFRRVQEADEAVEALECLRAVPIDLVITDLRMNPINGVELTHMIRRAPDSVNPFVPIIMMSGHSDRGNFAAARDAGISSFLVKPLSARALFNHITLCINDKRAFVRCAAYFGPDRRHPAPRDYTGPKRRRSDAADEELDLDAL